MKKKLKGGLETVIATVIIVGLVAAILLTTVIPMAKSGDNVVKGTTDNLANHQMTIGPSVK